MKRDSQIKKILKLEAEVSRIRASLGISNRDEVIFQADEDGLSDKEIVVVADGLGGAKLLVVEGNYPIDYLTSSEKPFDSEDKACEVAAKMAWQPVTPR